MTSLSAVDWTLSAAVKAGDVVSADAGGMPVYRVVAVAEEGRAWLEDEHQETVQVASLRSFPWKAVRS